MPDCKQDDIRYLYGVEISSRWYFFFGPTIVLSQTRPTTPGTFSELHHSALEQVFRGYLKKSPTGEWEINERFFNDLTGVGICFECKTQEEFDKVYLEIVNKNWRYKDTTEYTPVK